MRSLHVGRDDRLDYMVFRLQRKILGDLSTSLRVTH